MRRVLLALTVLTAGCASYKAAPLNALSTPNPAQDVTVTAKAFNVCDCERYLDRNILSAGYQPVQLYIENNSDADYVFSLSRFSLPHARAEEVASKVHTSTVGRIVGYGTAGLVTGGIFFIPAIVDGVKSAKANKSLDYDFTAKTARDQIIPPHSHFNAIVFIPTSAYQPVFNLTLVDSHTNMARSFRVTACN
jgi:hypothetical protein